LLATAIPHHKFRKLSPRQAWKVGIVICGIGLITWSCPSTNHFHSADFVPQITFRISANYPYSPDVGIGKMRLVRLVRKCICVK